MGTTAENERDIVLKSHGEAYNSSGQNELGLDWNIDEDELREKARTLQTEHALNMARLEDAERHKKILTGRVTNLEDGIESMRKRMKLLKKEDEDERSAEINKQISVQKEMVSEMQECLDRSELEITKVKEDNFRLNSEKRNEIGKLEDQITDLKDQL